MNATWQKLINALLATKKQKLAENIGKALTPPVMIPQQVQAPAAESQPQLLLQFTPGDEGTYSVCNIISYLGINS